MTLDNYREKKLHELLKKSPDISIVRTQKEYDTAVKIVDDYIAETTPLLTDKPDYLYKKINPVLLLLFVNSLIVDDLNLIEKQRSLFMAGAKDRESIEKTTEIETTDSSKFTTPPDDASRKYSKSSKNVPDYYEILGVSPDASFEEIRKAYREKMKTAHPDMGGNPEDAIRYNLAFEALKNEKTRNDYDEIRKSQSAVKQSLTPELTAYTGVMISVSPSSEQMGMKLNKKTEDYLKNLEGVENTIVDNKFVAELKATGKLPENANGYEIITALKLHSMGVSSVDFIQKTYDSSLLSQHKEQLYTAGIIMSALEDTNSQEFNNVREFFQNPEVNIQTYSVQPQSSPSQISMSNDAQNVLSFVTDEVKDRGIDFLQDKAKKYAGDALKKGWTKAAQALGKKAVEKGAQVAATAAAETTGVAATAAAAGIPTGGIGTVVVLAGSVLIAIGKKTIGKGLELITGEKKFSKQIRDVAIVGGGMALLSGIPIIGIPLLAFGVIPGLVGVSVGSRIVGAFTATAGVAMFLLTTAVVSLLSNIALAFVAIIVSLVVIYSIINMSAYVVPPGGFGTKTEMMAKGEYFPSEGGGGTNPYLSVNKKASPSKVENDFQGNITYTLTICASISGAKIESVDCDCTVYGITDIVPGEPDNPTCSVGEDFGASGVIPANTCQTFTFTEPLSGITYQNTSIVNKCCVTVKSDNASTTDCGSASVTVGSPPMNCPSGSPMQCVGDDCNITFDFHPYEAVDINRGYGDCGDPVFSTHSGIITAVGYDEDYGNYVDIQTICEGQLMVTRYAHLESFAAGLTVGQTVSNMTYIGDVDNTGNSSGCHLHYEFRRCDVLENGSIWCHTYTCTSDGCVDIQDYISYPN